jgi:Mrp family chromosome partitioning ATPase
MVERLKIAIEKARAQRARLSAEVPGTPASGTGARSGFLGMRGSRAADPAVDEATPDPAALSQSVEPAWTALEQITLDPRHLERNRVITQARNEPAHVAFDVLRTRVLRAFEKHGWTRLGITSPTSSCGKTFIASNLALSLARQHDCRTVLMDMDLRSPSLAQVLGVPDPDPIRWFLSGEVAPGDYLRRVGSNLAIGLNAERVRDAAETMQAPATALALETMQSTYAPDIVVYDLPPMLSCDDVLGFVPQLDCVLLVVGGGRTKPAEVTECERLLADQTQLLGVLLNQAEDAAATQYGYG